jgi:hypothetical protein
MGNNRFQNTFSGIGSQIINAGKSEEIIKKAEEETAATKEGNVIPIKKEEESPLQEQEQSKEVELKQPKEIIQQKHDDNLFIIDIDESEIEKKYCNFYLSKKTVDLIEKYAGKKKDGKSGMNKSQLVDFILQQAFTVLEVKNNK